MASGAAKKILIIEDERDILQLVQLYLEKEGFRTITATTGAEGLTSAKQHKPDLILLDLMLPEIDGLEVCKRLRSATETGMIPIIMLTAKAEESDQVIGLELGADDYVTKPFSPKALVARVKALFRRTDRSRQESQTAYQYGKLAMDLDRHEVTVQGKDVPLTAKEFGLLERSEEHTSELQSRLHLVCRLLLEKKKIKKTVDRSKQLKRGDQAEN